jgi:apolipoprotein N-acyltransferase
MSIKAIGTRLLKRLAANLKNKRNWLSFTAGLSLVFAYAPFSQWWIMLIALPLFLNSINGVDIKSASKQGFIFALGWFGSGISWVHVSIDTFGGLPLILSLLLMLLLCCYLALYPALACYFSSRFSPNRQFSLWLLPTFWLLCEYLRANLFTGFPWLSIGYSQIDGPLSSFAPLIGEVGISALLLIISITLINIFKGYYRKTHLLLLIGIFISAHLLTNVVWVKPTEQTVTTALVQGNIEQSMKWQQEKEWPTMLKYLDHSRKNYDADIIIWPESAITAIEPAAQDFLVMADKSAALNNSAIITGILNYKFDSKAYFNSLIVLGQKESTDKNGHYRYDHPNRYYKNHLLPIGEFVPFGEWLRKVAPLFNLQYSSFSRGDYVQPNLIAKGYHLLPLICFEIAFPEQLAANFTDKTDILLTVSNDSWFGNSHGPHQHLEIARMRALEFGRPLLRATNNGVTAIVDHHGSIQTKLPQFTETVLKSEIKLVRGNTFYSQYWRLIHWLFPFVSLVFYYLLHFKLNRKTINKNNQ